MSNGAIDAVFPRQVCINLDRRADRWQRMQARLAAHGLHRVQRFAAVDGSTVPLPPQWPRSAGAYGCLLSHVEVVDEARRAGAPHVLILEDDVVFDADLETRFDAGIAQLPADWDMLYFGALHTDEPIRISETLARITRANSTYAYVLRDSIYDHFIELNRRAEAVLDNNTYLLQQRFNCYCFMPHLAWVETDWSDAQNKVERHWYLQKSLVLFGAGADRLLRDTAIVFAHPGPESENLQYLVRYYDEHFSSLPEIVVVEGGSAPTVERTALPANCRYLFLEGEFDRQRCFEAGIAAAEPQRKFLLLSDSDLYLETLDVRANLRMCEEYGAATGCAEIYELTPADSLLLRTANTTRGINVPRQAGAARPGVCRFVRRDASPQRVFASPNHALRLRHQ